MRHHFLRLAALILPSVTALAHMDKDTNYDSVIPVSSRTIDVEMLSVLSGRVPLSSLYGPSSAMPVSTTLLIAGYVFLLEHHTTNRRVLFDMELHKDWQSLAPAAVKQFSQPDNTFLLVVKKDVPDQLVECGVALETVDSIVWRCVSPVAYSVLRLTAISHHRWGCVGDITKIPNPTCSSTKAHWRVHYRPKLPIPTPPISRAIFSHLTVPVNAQRLGEDGVEGEVKVGVSGCQQRGEYLSKRRCVRPRVMHHTQHDVQNGVDQLEHVFVEHQNEDLGETRHAILSKGRTRIGFVKYLPLSCVRQERRRPKR
jgi:hypothetical protein